MFGALRQFGEQQQTEELYDLRSEYGQKKRALTFCNSTFTTLGERKFCILHILEDVRYSTQ
eukprot:CAMPEP_0114127192 /NCGR_PEP_ID=MMETSP0043_2-20121206/10237_1 /TAXON_ID=464988 /ORGANISM="Hemiselmis andersenii, Strain CCMP644" /LENGTH=60 /DNA_ID=CAMNT_0001220237 /DNA_START=25 /DNA_END=207 /DNA_ORIENTATION=+